jgi:hypothetical protein
MFPLCWLVLPCCTEYPQFQKNELFICGESYAGKYVPAFGMAIHEANAAYQAYVDAHPQWRGEEVMTEVVDGESTAPRPNHRRHTHSKKAAPERIAHSSRSTAPFNVPNALPIPLVGLSIGDGMMDPLTQIAGYGELLYNLGMIDKSQRAYMESVENQIIQLITQQRYLEAFHVFDALMMADLTGYPSYFTNVTGLTDYYNFLSVWAGRSALTAFRMQHWTPILVRPARFVSCSLCVRDVCLCLRDVSCVVSVRPYTRTTPSKRT